jgi:hypothetical protein
MSFTIVEAYRPADPALPRIAKDSALERATVAASSTETGYAAANLLTRDTWQRWRPSAVEATVTADGLDPAETIDYVAIARHNLGSAGITAELELEISSVWTKVADLAPEQDSPLFLALEPTLATGVRLSFGSEAIPTVAVLMAGQAVTIPRPLRGSMQPVFLARQTEVLPQVSETGELLGQIVRRSGVEVSPSWRNIPGSFYRSTLRGLARDLPGCAIFFQWSPLLAPDEAVFGTVTGDVSGSHVSGRDFYEFGFSMQGVAA